MVFRKKMPKANLPSPALTPPPSKPPQATRKQAAKSPAKSASEAPPRTVIEPLEDRQHL